MNLSPDVCYRAMLSRDHRFDGRFFAAVTTTRIYCRPICPAPKPKRGNVRYFACAAAAEDAGFRPCMRCRPEASPGTPAWLGTSSTVTRALRLIAEGCLDNAGVDDLAERLGIGARHLRRLFLDHLGATPIAVAQTRRVHFAKTLLDDTSLSITDVAFTAGFSSIRRFNDAFRRTFGRTPTDVRRPRPFVGTPRRSSSDGGDALATTGDRHDLELRLPYRPPFDFNLLLSFMRARVIAGVEFVGPSVYRRAVRLGDATGTIEVAQAPERHQLLLRIPAGLSRDIAVVAERVRRMFDLKADPAEIQSHLQTDAMLKQPVKMCPGLRVPGAWDPFETSVRAILGQQVTVKAATTMCARLVERYGERVQSGDGDLRRVFPSPARLSRARLSLLGMPGARGRALRSLAAAFRDGAIRADGTWTLDEFVEALTRIDGIGPWTAHYIAMRVCGEPDAFPSSDLALRRAAAMADPRIDSDRALVARAEAWRPWRAYATMYLWTWYAQNNKRREEQ